MKGSSRGQRKFSLRTMCVLVVICALPAVAQMGPDPTPPKPATPVNQKETQSLVPQGVSVKPINHGVIAPGKPTPESKGFFGSTALPLLAVLALVVGAGAGLRTLARRNGGLRATLGAGGRSPAGILEILGRYPVGRGVTLILLKLDSRVLLLSQSAGGRFGAGANFTTLAELKDPEEVAAILTKSRDAEGDSLAEKFKSMLSRFDRQMDPTLVKPTAVTQGSTSPWESRTDIPVIDLTQREPGRSGTLRNRLSQARTQTGERS